MQISPRALAVAALGCGPLLLAAGCGTADTSGSRSSLAPIEPSSYVTIAPATTTTTTTLAPEEIAASGVSPTEQTYTVVAGDSLSKIASLYGITLDQLINYNQWSDGVNHFIFPGDTVLIPPESKIPGAGTPTTTPPAGSTPTADSQPASSDGECPSTYVIQSGDTTRIKVAERFGITYQEMDAANASTPGYANFVVGTPITIPCPS